MMQSLISDLANDVITWLALGAIAVCWTLGFIDIARHGWNGEK